jgi:formylglycine-generating enzyme required for sulfatase activity
MNTRTNSLVIAGLLVLLLTALAPAFPQKAGDNPPSKPKAGAKWKSLTDGLEMIWIPAGDFLMGSPLTEAGRNPTHDAEGNTWDETQHKVTIAKGFWMDTTEVTNEAYRKFIVAKPEWQKDKYDAKAQGAPAPVLYLEKWTGNDYPAGQGNYPVMTVTWYAARAYCGWAGERLPTEAEWEYAARAGTMTAYWWGDTFDGTKANLNQKNTEPVDNPNHRNSWGLFDMIGNVQEWTSSLLKPYPYRADDGREDLDAPGLRVERGGGYRQSAVWARAAVRTGFEPTFSTRRLGMRCVR